MCVCRGGGTSRWIGTKLPPPLPSFLRYTFVTSQSCYLTNEPYTLLFQLAITFCISTHALWVVELGCEQKLLDRIFGASVPCLDMCSAALLCGRENIKIVGNVTQLWHSLYPFLPSYISVGGREVYDDSNIWKGMRVRMFLYFIFLSVRVLNLNIEFPNKRLVEVMNEFSPRHLGLLSQRAAFYPNLFEMHFNKFFKRSEC